VGQRALAQGKKNAGPGGVDRLPRRERVQPPPLGEVHLGAQGPDPRPHPPLQLEALSMSAACAFRPDGSEASLVFGMQPGSYNDESIMEFLTELHRHLDGDKVTLIWDGLPSHRSKAMQAFLKKQRRLAGGRAAPGLCPRPQSGRAGLGQPQGRRARQPLPDTIGEAEEIVDEGSVASATTPGSPSHSSGIAASSYDFRSARYYTKVFTKIPTRSISFVSKFDRSSTSEGVRWLPKKSYKAS
jgi:hypothetical protein